MVNEHATKEVTGRVIFRVGAVVIKSNNCLIDKAPDSYWMIPSVVLWKNETIIDGLDRVVSDQLGEDLKTYKELIVLEQLYSEKEDTYESFHIFIVELTTLNSFPKLVKKHIISWEPLESLNQISPSILEAILKK